MNREDLAKALQATCGLSTHIATLVIEIPTETLACETNTDIVVPCEWTEEDLVQGDIVWEQDYITTQVTDIAPLLARTHIRA